MPKSRFSPLSQLLFLQVFFHFISIIAQAQILPCQRTADGTSVSFASPTKKSRHPVDTAKTLTYS